MRPALLAEFATADAMLEAAERLREQGYRELETYSPFPTSERTGREPSRSRLPAAVFLGGLGGALLGYGIQWYTSVIAFPHNIGGRPVHSAPAFIPITFETLVLVAALVAFVGALVTLGLPALWHPLFELDGFERASSDRFWVAVRTRAGRSNWEEIERALVPLKPLRTARVEPES